MTYPVLTKGKIRQQIHIQEYLAEVRCKFPTSAENTPSPSKEQNNEKQYSKRLPSPRGLAVCIISVKLNYTASVGRIDHYFFDNNKNRPTTRKNVHCSSDLLQHNSTLALHVFIVISITAHFVIPNYFAFTFHPAQ